MWAMAPCPRRPVEMGCGRRRPARIRRHPRISLGSRIPKQLAQSRMLHHREQLRRRVRPQDRDLKLRHMVVLQLVLQGLRDESLPTEARVLHSRLLLVQEVEAQTSRAATGLRRQAMKVVEVVAHRRRHQRRMKERRERLKTAHIAPIAQSQLAANTTSVGNLAAESALKNIGRHASRGTVVV